MVFLKYIIALILFYLFIYNPNFSFDGEMGSIKLLYFILFFYIVINNKKYFSLINTYRAESLFFLCFILFALIRTLVGGDSVELYKHVILYIENFFLPLAILCFFNNNFNPSGEKIIKMILVTGSVAAIISTLCIVNPSINHFVKFELQLIDKNESVFDALNRGFGLGESLTYSYGIVQGIILGVGILNIKHNKWFTLFIPCFVASILLNARTGIFIPIVAVLIYLLVNRGVKNIVSIVMGGVIVYVLMSYILQSYNLNDDQQSFIEDFSKQLIETNERGLRDNSGTVGILLSEHIVLPSNLEEWLLGKGYLIFRVRSSHNSDSGFFQQLNYGGLIYSFLMISFIVYIVRRMVRHKISRDFIFLFFVTLIIAHIKGNFIMNSGGFRLMMLLYYYLLYLAFCEKIIIGQKVSC